ncbi:hypothetical protein K443DRAFT_8127 [Laccaria amethystina LaAM-08-1]|uniref:Uncharacterized protein n=1 Tax=Laccaria amethystina LaAM-08-1 TaxID=1095629 RepID=A0A0C9XDV3_9AGAR|nr:hypothetical protein K443DRAFT_8127 [Laccaria amethystina LaAM-08-1]
MFPGIHRNGMPPESGPRTQPRHRRQTPTLDLDDVNNKQPSLSPTTIIHEIGHTPNAARHQSPPPPTLVVDDSPPLPPNLTRCANATSPAPATQRAPVRGQSWIGDGAAR